MHNEGSTPLLADLVSLDLLLAKHGRLMDSARKFMKIAITAGIATERERYHLAALDRVQQEFFLKRNSLREVFAQTHLHLVLAPTLVRSH